MCTPEYLVSTQLLALSLFIPPPTQHRAAKYPAALPDIGSSITHKAPKQGQSLSWTRSWPSTFLDRYAASSTAWFGSFQFLLCCQVLRVAKSLTLGTPCYFDTTHSYSSLVFFLVLV